MARLIEKFKRKRLRGGASAGGSDGDPSGGDPSGGAHGGATGAPGSTAPAPRGNVPASGNPSAPGRVRVEKSALTNDYARGRDAGHKVDPRLQVLFALVIVLLIVYSIGLVVPKGIFDAALHDSSGGYSLAWFFSDLSSNINALVVTLSGGVPESGSYAALMIRYVVIALTGCAMATCGAVFQGSFRNALVTPSTLGVMAGASLGMAVWVAFFYDESAGQVLFGGESTAQATAGSYLSSSYGFAICSFIGCLAVVGLTLAVVRVSSRGTSGLLMIITGQVIGGIMGAITNTLRYYYVTAEPDGQKAQMLMQLQISSFYRTFSLVDIAAVGIPLVITFAVVMRYRDQLTLLAFSEAEARAMGVETRKLRFVVVGLCTLLTAIVVSFCGHVGFIGFLVPHMARRLVGPNFRYLLPVSLVLGAVFVLASYVLVSMTLGQGYETMTGMFVSIFGAGVFLFTVLRGKGASNGRF